MISRWQALVTLLSIESLVLMVVIMLTEESEIHTLLIYFDVLMCVVLLADFCTRFSHAKGRRMDFLIRDKGILDLIGSLPLAEELHWARIARLWRIARLISAIGSLSDLASHMRRQPLELAFVTTLAVIINLSVIGSILVLYWESAAPNGNITTAETTLWWAIQTVSTVGYGDYYPVTAGGRVVAALLMLSGVGLFGTLTAWAATPLLRRDN